MLVSAVNPTSIVYQLYFYASTMNHARERNTMCSVTSDLSNDNMILSQNVFFETQKMFFVPAGRIGSKEECGSG